MIERLVIGGVYGAGIIALIWIVQAATFICQHSYCGAMQF